MTIRAKYPKTIRKYMQCETQEYGAYSGNNNSNISKVNSRESDGNIENDRASNWA